MNSLLPVLQAIAADQAAGVRTLELGIVTEVFAAGGSAPGPAVNVRVRGSGTELHRVPVVVGRIGLTAVPRVGDLVVLGFLGGTLDTPLILGSLYDEQSQPPEAEPEEIVYEVPDAPADGIRRVQVTVADGGAVTIEDGAVSVVMGGTSLTVEADGAVVVDAAGDIRLSAGGDLVLEARGDITASGMNVSLEAQVDAGVKGNVAASLEGGATAKVKGAAVTVAGVVQFSAS